MEIIALRILIPLIIFKFPFIGGLISAGLDYFDLHLISLLNNNIGDYQRTDKILDFYYLSLEALIVLSWKNINIKKAAIALYLYRGLGIILFEFTGIRQLLFFFPNLFEFFFLLYLFFQGISGRDYLTGKKDRILFLILIFVFFSYKLYHEYSLHILQRGLWPGSEIFFLPNQLDQFIDIFSFHKLFPNLYSSIKTQSPKSGL